jgi:hypothetical protein
MKNLILLLVATISLFISSCANFGESLVDGIFETATDSIFESSEDRKIDSDTRRMQSGTPLKHYSSESRLRAAREDRTINDMMSD